MYHALRGFQSTLSDTIDVWPTPPVHCQLIELKADVFDEYTDALKGVGTNDTIGGSKSLWSGAVFDVRVTLFNVGISDTGDVTLTVWASIDTELSDDDMQLGGTSTAMSIAGVDIDSQRACAPTGRLASAISWSNGRQGIRAMQVQIDNTRCWVWLKRRRRPTTSATARAQSIRRICSCLLSAQHRRLAPSATVVRIVIRGTHGACRAPVARSSARVCCTSTRCCRYIAARVHRARARYPSTSTATTSAHVTVSRRLRIERRFRLTQRRMNRL